MGDDRKYRHRGYMDSGSDASRGPRGHFESGPPKSEGAPRGRSAGFDKELVVRCKKCGDAVRGLDAIEPDSPCPKCGTPLHACAQCRHFDSGARWECAQNTKIPARVADKSAANACRAFDALASFDLTGTKAVSTPTDARRAFDALFKK